MGISYQSFCGKDCKRNFQDQTGVLTFSIFADVLPTASSALKSVYEYVIFYIYVGHVLHFCFLFVSILVTAAIPLDRLKLIVFPFFVISYGTRWQNSRLNISTGNLTMSGKKSGFGLTRRKLRHNGHSCLV